MEAQTISDNFRILLGDSKRVRAAVFTTFNFETDFFEEEIIPLLLDRDLAFSSDKQVKSLQVREALNEVELPIEVFYDKNIFHQQADKSPAMEYLHHGVNHAPHAFHPKLSLILAEDRSAGTQQLLVGTGSANLTQAGWWENVECQHWEIVADGAAPRMFLNRLRDDTAYLLDFQHAASTNSESALHVVTEFLASCTASNAASPVHYYGLRGVEQWHQKRRYAFVNFLRQALQERSPHYRRWSLDIISPYFATDASFDAHLQIAQDLGIDDIRLLLPVNDRREALCTKDYYDVITKSDIVTWSRWSKPLSKALFVGPEHFRRTHAKIYHLYNGKQSWVFTGSVNFSRNAFHNNIEAGFFTKLDYCKSLLEPCEQIQEHFCDPADLTREELGEAPDGVNHEIRLAFDWKTSLLTGFFEGEGGAIMTLLDGERRPLVRNVHLNEEPRAIDCPTESIRRLLTESGFVQLTGYRVKDNEPIAEHRVLVQQVNWTHKPVELPNLTPQQIFEIYAGMSFERRNQMVARLKEQQLLHLGVAVEAAAQDNYEGTVRQFFSEYAELFQAFRNIRRRMRKAAERKQFKQVDYYLTGTSYDSLPTLFGSLFDGDSRLEAVTRYLALLCMLEIYESTLFCEQYGATQWRQTIRTKLSEMETTGTLKLTARNSEREDVFYAWFRSEFFKQYWQAAKEDNDAGH